MLILPAIDLRDGQCVRLRQGDYAQETVFGSDPAAMAERWVRQGAKYLHLVDLDGAKQGFPVNGDSIRHILARVQVPCELGGGLRTEEHVAEVLGWGIDRVVIGTRALKDPGWFERLCRRFPGSSNSTMSFSTSRAQAANCSMASRFQSRQASASHWSGRTTCKSTPWFT